MGVTLGRLTAYHVALNPGRCPVATVVVKRGPRRPAPELPGGELVIQAPPELRQVTGSRWSVLLTVLPMLTGTVATAMMFAGRQGGTYSYVIGGVFGVSSLGMLATGLGSGGGAPKKAEMMAARREYLRHLAGLRRRVRENTARQRDALHYRHPRPATLWSTVDSHRLWERRPGDGDFGVARVGIGPQTLATPLVAPVTPPLDELEPMTAGALRRFLDAYAVVPDLPVAVAVIGGPRSGKSCLLRTVICGLALTHTPAQAQVYCLDFGGGTLAGVRDLPHVGGVAGRLEPDAVRRTVGEVIGLLTERERHGLAAGDGHVFLVVDGWSTIRGEYDDLEAGITDLATRGLAYRIHVLVAASR
jgi:DNA segregation ATPase FtsK/SpoIIIE-like protein